MEPSRVSRLFLSSGAGALIDRILSRNDLSVVSPKWGTLREGARALIASKAASVLVPRCDSLTDAGERTYSEKEVALNGAALAVHGYGHAVLGGQCTARCREGGIRRDHDSRATFPHLPFWQDPEPVPGLTGCIVVRQVSADVSIAEAPVAVEVDNFRTGSPNARIEVPRLEIAKAYRLFWEAEPGLYRVERANYLDSAWAEPESTLVRETEGGIEAFVYIDRKQQFFRLRPVASPDSPMAP